MKLVLCEGNDEVSVLRELCGARGIPDLTFEPYKGRDNLPNVLRELPKRPEYAQQQIECLAILLDANGNPNGAWQRVLDGVREYLGVRLSERGLFVGDKPSIAGYIVAGPDGTGMLEDLCLMALKRVPGFDCLDQYFACLSEKTDRKDYHAKAKFRAWMSAQSDFDLRLGLAAAKGYVPWGSSAFDPLAQFLASI
jgi:hypothetical protein